MDFSAGTIALMFIGVWLVLFLPGSAWLAWERAQGRDALEWAAEAVGISLALTAVLGVLTFYLGIFPGAVGFLGLYALGLLAWIAPRLLWGWNLRLTEGGLLALAFILLLVSWRLFQARSLALPAWVDSVHHSLLVRIILERGGLPPDWMPYLAVPFYYHFGFQLAAACFAAWSQLDPPQAVLVFGQVMNAFVALSIYRLGKALGWNWVRAGLAALLVGFFFTMPAYYVTWGRYTLLAGLVVLPLAMAAGLDVRRQPHNRWAWARLALYTTGTFCCHYLAAGLLGLFLALLGLEEALRWLRTHSLAAVAWQPLAAAAIGTLVALPWLLRVWSYSQGSASITLGDPFDPERLQALSGAWDYTLYLLGPQRSQILGLVGLAGAAWVFWRGGGRLLAAWAVLVAFLATPYAPRFAPFRQDHVTIILFFPAALLAGRLIPDLCGLLGRLRFKWLPAAATGLAALALLAWGLTGTADILNPSTVFVTPDDVQALRWIQANTGPQARFFINAELWQGATYRGLDGGYWITPFTGRATEIAPAAVGMGDADTVLAAAGVGKQASHVKACDAAFWSLVGEQKLNYAYLRQGSGSLQPAALQDCAGAEQVYSEGQVYIFKLFSPQ